MSHDTAIDLSVLAKPDVIETVDYEALVTLMRDDLVARFPAIVGVVDLESEPARKLIEVFAYREMMLRARVNDAARANLLAFAINADLDHLAAFYDVTRLPGEDDARLRARTILAIRGRSTGGTEPRYRFVAMSANVRVADAVVWREGTSPLVRCAIFATDNNGVPDPAMLQEVEEHLTAADVRMVNDTILVTAAVQKVQNITATLTLLPNASASILSDIEAALRAEWLAERGLGFDMTLSWLTARLMRAGVYKVAISTPSADVIAAPSEAIAIGTVTLTVAGRNY
jgi:phage-related baseplate assembly protein